MGSGGKAEFHIRNRGININAVPRQQVAEVATVNHGERVQPKNAGNQTFRFNVGQTAGADSKFIVAMPLGNARTCAFDVTHGEAEPLT
ncbi:MAG TPA: hypothetical protein VMO80_11015 [Terriglobales bacterium]|nr:hypothetical protein [Terriglobales bacterium]